MELYDLNIQILDYIFTANFTQQITAQYNEWHQNLDPSYKLIRHMLDDYLSANQFKMLKIASQTVLLFFARISKFKLPRTFVRAFLSIIQQHIRIVEDIIKIEDMARNWKNIGIDVLEEYLNAFKIELEGISTDKKSNFVITSSEIEERINELIEGKDYDSAIRLIQLIKYPQQNLEVLFAHMVNNKEASKAANFLKTHKLQSKKFPLINKKLNKNMIKYFLNSIGWDAAEQIFEGQSEALWNLVSDLLHKKKNEQAKSVWWRNRQILSADSKGLNKEIATIVNEWESQQVDKLKQSLIQNTYFDDYFGPSDKQKHLSLQSFGINQHQVIFLTNKEAQIDRFVHSLQNAKQCAIDTQSIVGKTKLDKQRQEPPSIIQVAFIHEVFIIDCGNCHEIVKQAMLKYLSSDKLLLGHALENDLDALLIGIGLSKEQRRMFKFGNVVDTCKLFKTIYPQEKHSNLAYICLKVLGKQVCKKQTLTNWARRPLRRNQLHYAALDAICVIHIYRRLEEEVGTNMLTYFLQEM